MEIFGIILLSLEGAFLIFVASLYIYKELRRMKYQKENRKLAIDEIMMSMKAVCEDNDKLYEAYCQLKKENEELKKQCNSK